MLRTCVYTNHYAAQKQKQKQIKYLTINMLRNKYKQYLEFVHRLPLQVIWYDKGTSFTKLKKYSFHFFKLEYELKNQISMPWKETVTME